MMPESPEVRRISTEDPLYQEERELRNKILLRPIGIPDYGWEMYDKESWHFVALPEGQVIACAILHPLGDGGAKLMQMAVDEPYQGQGVGKRIVEALLAFAKEEGLREVFCHARENAVSFYDKLGFEAYGDPFEEVGVPHRNMRYTLGE